MSGFVRILLFAVAIILAPALTADGATWDLITGENAQWVTLGLNVHFDLGR